MPSRPEYRPGAAPDVVIPQSDAPVRRAAPTRADISDLPSARNDQQFTAAAERAAKRGVPLVVTFTDTTSNISGEELRLLASAKAEHGQKAEVLLVDRSKLAPNSELARHFEKYVARNGYPVTMLAKPSESLKPSDMFAGSPHVADSRYGADCMMTAKLDSMQRPGRRIETPQPAQGGSDKPVPPPTSDSAPRPSEVQKPAAQPERTQPRSFNVSSQEDYAAVLKTAGENKEPVVALFYSSSSPMSRRAVQEYMRAREHVPGATYMAYDVDQLDKMSPADRAKSPIATYADYVRRDIGYPTTMIVPVSPPEKSGDGYSPLTNSATFRGGASAEAIRDALVPAHQLMSRLKFPEAPKPAAQPAPASEEQPKPSNRRQPLPGLEIRYA